MNKQNPQQLLILIPKHAKQIFIPGPEGKLDCLELAPQDSPIKGIAIVFHPDPKGGGSYTNKIVQSLASVLNQNGYLCYCPNLRGVGLSEGNHDFGGGEIEDALAIYNNIRSNYPDLPLILAGFSFGAMIASKIAAKIPHSKLILVGPAITRYEILIPDTAKTIIIHGEEDELIAANEVFTWAKQINQPIIWCPNTGHFFHGKLVMLKNILNNLKL